MTPQRVAAFSWVFALVLCLGSARGDADAAWPVTDDTGARLSLVKPAARIISLAPGATEMLFAAGAGDRIVATVRDADTPEAAKKIPRIGDANAIVFEKLFALQPDAIVIWEDLTNRVLVDSLRKLKIPLYSVRAKRLSDIPASVRRLGVLAGTQAVAVPAAAALDRKLAAIDTRRPQGEPMRVFYMIWAEPLYTIGSRHIISDAIRRCGGRNIFDDIDFPAPVVEFEVIVKRNPDLILMSAPPITARDWRERWQRFTTIHAVATRQVLTYPDVRLDRMGPSAIDAVSGLCEIMQQAATAQAAAKVAKTQAAMPQAAMPQAAMPQAATKNPPR